MPSGSPITTTDLGELLKRLYAPWEIQQQVNLTHPVLAKCAAKGSAQLGGDGFRFPVRLESAEGHAYISETQDIPTSGRTLVRQAVVPPFIHAGVVELTGLSVSVSSGDAMAFARSFDENVSQTLQAMTAYKEGVLFRDGSGLLGTVTVLTSGDTLELDDVAWIREGMKVDIIDATGTSPVRHDIAIEVDSVDWPNKTITFAANYNVAVAVGDRIFITGSQATSGALVNKEPEGFQAAFNTTGTYLNIDRSAIGNWRSNVIDVSGFLDEDVLMRTRTRITQESGIPVSGQAGRFGAVVHPQQVDVLFKLCIPRIRYSGNDNFDLGYDDSVSFGRTPFETSYNCPVDEGYVGDWMYFMSLYTPNGELHIDTEYNGSALKWVANKDAGLVFIKAYENFACKRPNAFGRWTNLSQPAR